MEGWSSAEEEEEAEEESSSSSSSESDDECEEESESLSEELAGHSPPASPCPSPTPGTSSAVSTDCLMGGGQALTSTTALVILDWDDTIYPTTALSMQGYDVSYALAVAPPR